MPVELTTPHTALHQHTLPLEMLLTEIRGILLHNNPHTRHRPEAMANLPMAGNRINNLNHIFKHLTR